MISVPFLDYVKYYLFILILFEYFIIKDRYYNSETFSSVNCCWNFIDLPKSLFKLNMTLLLCCATAYIILKEYYGVLVSLICFVR